MEIRGEHRIEAPRHEVWEALQDPQVLTVCIGGCEDFDEVGPACYDVTVQVGISAIRGTYSGRVTMSEADPPHSYRLVATGSGMAGSVEGDAIITLAEDGGATLVRYEADVRAQGAIARLGSRLIGSAARMMAGRFFEAFERELAQRVA